MLDADLPDMPGLLGYFRKHAPPYLQSVYSAVLANEIVTGLVVPKDAFHRFEGQIPFVVTVSDDVKRSYGPTGFNQGTLTALFRQCRAAVVITVWPQPMFYDEAVAFAVGQQASVAIVETNMVVEGEWLRSITSINPEIRLAIWSPQQAGVA